MELNAETGDRLGYFTEMISLKPKPNTSATAEKYRARKIRIPLVAMFLLKDAERVSSRQAKKEKFRFIF